METHPVDPTEKSENATTNEKKEIDISTREKINEKRYYMVAAPSNDMTMRCIDYVQGDKGCGCINGDRASIT